uniref:dynein heavy chain domain-containing protein 1 n=1 Tax=Pristiophorus japonicus TaxID=55135 RepID=UPI00398EF62F
MIMASAEETPSLAQDKLPSIAITEHSEFHNPARGSMGRREPCERAATWALSIRQRLSSRMRDNRKPHGPDVDLLVAELINTFIAIVQTNNRGAWCYLYEVLRLTAQYRDHLSGKPQLLRHLESVYHHYHIHRANLSDIDILGAMAQAFPRDSSPLYEGSRKPGIVTPPHLPPLPQEHAPHTPFPPFATQPNPFVLERGHDDPHSLDRNKLLLVSDLYHSVSLLGATTAQLEAAWQTKLGLMSKPFRVNLQRDLPHTPIPTNTAYSQVEREIPGGEVRMVPWSDGWSVSHPRTGESVVEMLAKCRHLSKTKFYYLNISPNQQFSPYDLTVVPKSRLDPEHYVFSTFGVLSTSPSLGTEVMSLGDWHREALLWRALRHIPFFKNYLLRKAFTRWYRNVKRLWVQNHQNLLHSCLLPAIPHFGAALLHISRLLQELRQVRWLPVGVTQSHTLDDFQQQHGSRISNNRGLLEKFFNYCTAVLQLVREDSYRMVADCETQLQQVKNNFLKEPVNIQRAQQEAAERRLQEAKWTIQSLGRLGALVSHMTVQNLIAVVQSEVNDFVTKVLQTTDPSQPPLLTVRLEFDAEGHMNVFPPRQVLLETMSGLLMSVGDNITAVVEAMHNVSPSQPDSKPEDQADGKTGSQRDSPGRDEKRSTWTMCKVCKRRLTTGLGDTETGPCDRCSLPPPSVLLSQMGGTGMMVRGERLKAQFYPPTSSFLRAELTSVGELQRAQRMQKVLIENAMKDIILFRARHIWLLSTRQMVSVRDWSELNKMHSWSPRKFRDRLTLLKTWLRRARQIGHLFVAKNRVLALDCSAIQEEIVPAVLSMRLDILSVLKFECEHNMWAIITELTEAIDQLQEKPTEVVAFASYFSKSELYNHMASIFQQGLDHTLSLIQIVRQQFEQHSSYEEREEEQVEYLWNTFQQDCNAATEFTRIQRENVINTLEHSFKVLTAEVRTMNSIITSGPYLDPSQNRATIIQQIQELKTRFLSVATSLRELSESRNTIKGKPANLAFLTLAETNINSRWEVWNLYYSALEEIKEWKTTPFSQFDVKLVVEVVDEWLSRVGHLKESLPADDPIVAATEQLVLEFQRCLLPLVDLRHPEMQQRHWKAIFTEMGEAWNPEWEMTVDDLLAYDLPASSHFIKQILTKARKDFDLQQLLLSVENFWKHYEFRLVTHIAVVHYQESRPDKSKQPNGEKLQQPGEDWAAKDSGTLVLIEMERLRWYTDDSLMTLSMISSTAAAGNTQEEAEKLMEMIQHFGELLDLWKMFQDKWVFLHQLFYEMELNARKPDPQLMAKIEEVDELYRQVIQAVSTNPSVLSVILTQDTKKYQGRTLRMIFSTGIAAMENLILHMYHLVESARQLFARLYFLSEDDVLHLLTVQSDPRKLLPYVKKCFASVRELQYEVTRGTGVELVCPKVNVLAIYGDLRERVDLLAPLESAHSAILWLRNLELRIQQSLFRALGSCVTERAALAGEINSLVMADTGARSETYKAAQLMTHISKLAASFPVQCILIAEEVCWQREAEKALFAQSATKEWFKALASTKVNRLALNVRGYCKRSAQDPEDSRTLSVLKCLTITAIKHRDIADNLMAADIKSEASFEWQKLIKYNFDPSWIFPKREAMMPLVTGFERSAPGPDHSQFGLRCRVSLLGTNSYYDYEYVGPQHSFVQTPLTERISLALVLALQNLNPCALVGPSGTGKATTLCYLARALGYQLVTLRCCKDTDLPFITRVLCGAVQSGAWLLLEKADSLSLGALSILGQHLTTIHHSYRKLIRNHNANASYPERNAGPSGKVSGRSLTDVTGNDGSTFAGRCTWSSGDLRRFDPTALGSIAFAGSVIPARVSYSVFMTLGTFDSSATIPENLRRVLRPVSVIRPDVKVITEAKLLATGFLKASHLAGKILSFFELAKDSGAIIDYCYLAAMDKVIDTAAKVLYQTLRTKEPEPGSNPHKGHSNPIEPLSAQGQHGQERDGGDGGSDRGAEMSDAVQSCLLGSHQRSSANTESEATEPPVIQNISTPVFESVLLVEEYSVLKALSIILFPAALDPEKLHCLKDLLRQMFPEACMPPYELEHDPSLRSAIEQELLDTEHQVTQELVSNILALYQALKVSRGVIMLGPSGSGKTTSYRTLLRAMNHLARNESVVLDQSDGTDPVHMSVQVSVCFPNSLSMGELLGEMEQRTWKNGILGKWLSEAESWLQARALVKDFQSPQVKPCYCVEHLQWIVLDGELCSDWMGPVSGLLAKGRCLTLSTGEKISLRDSISFILETTDLSNAAPPAVTWCNLVHCRGTDTWQAVLANSMAKIYQNYAVPRETAEQWRMLGQELVPNTLAFLEQHCVAALTQQADYATVQQNRVTYGLEEVMSFTRILNALLDKYMSRHQQQFQAQQEQEPAGVSTSSAILRYQRARLDDGVLPKDHLLAQSILAVAFTWGFGGHLHSSCWPQFDNFARRALRSSHHNINIPPRGLVYDYYINPATGCLEPLHRDNQTRNAAAYVFLPEMERFVKLLELLLVSGQPVLLVGEPLSGKTSFVQALKRLISCPTMHRLLISPNTRPQHARCHVTEKVFPSEQQQHSRPFTIAPNAKTNFLFFLDDVHAAPFKPGSRCQPVIEAFRHSLTCHGAYDGNCLQLRYFHSARVGYIATCTPSRGRGSSLSTRFSRLFTVLALPALSSDMLMAIYTPSVLGWLYTFPTYTLTRHALLARALLCSTVELYQQVRAKLRPSPSCAHYLFSVADVGRVLNGLLLMHPSSVSTLKKPTDPEEQLSESETVLAVTKTVVNLWLHESMRVFLDRLLTEEDRRTLLQILERVAQANFCSRLLEPAGELKLTQAMVEPSLRVPSAIDSKQQNYDQDELLLSLEAQNATEGAEPSHGGDGKTEGGFNLEPQPPQTLQVAELSTGGQSQSSDAPRNTGPGSSHSQSDTLPSVDPAATNGAGAGSPQVTLSPPPPNESESSRRKGKVRQKRVKSGGQNRRRKRSDTIKPLLPPHSMCTGEALRDLMFSKGAVRPGNTQQMYSPRWNPYREVASRTLAQQLRHIVLQDNLNHKTSHQIIFSQEAVGHFARIYRALYTPRAHCALLALTHSTGRKTLVRLAAHLTMAAIFPLSGHMSEAARAQAIKRASYQAGVQGRRTVIMAHGALEMDTFHNLCDVMAEGNYPGLYSADELQQLAKDFSVNKKLPWNMKAEQILERYFQVVVQFLHVVFLLDGGDCRPPLSLRSGLPGHLAHLLEHCSSVDVWQPWSQRVYTQIAASHLGIGNLSTLSRTNGKSIAQIWILAPVIIKVMALIHQSAISYAKHMAHTLPLITPQHFLDFIDLFSMASYYLEQSLGSQTERMELSLDKVQEVYNTAEEYRRKIDLLKQRLQQVAEEKRRLHEQFTKVRGEFMDLLSKCREEEFLITMLLRELEASRKKFEAEFSTVKPLYATALQTLQALSSEDLDEVRTYRAPPLPVVMVMNALCLMFGKPDGWDNVRLLISQPNFYQDLEFYDKENIPDCLFKALGEIVKQPEFQPAVVREASKAVESFSLWILAIYYYATITREYTPAFVNSYQSRINAAQTRLGVLRKKTFEMKKTLVDLLREDGDNYLSDSVTDFSNTDILRLVQLKEQDALRRLKEEEDGYLAEMEKCHKELEIAEDLIQVLVPHQFEWDEALRQSKDRRITVSGDGLLTAAAIIYFGPFEEKVRQELLEKWMVACYTGEIQMEPEDARKELVKLLSVKTSPASEGKVTSDSDHQRVPAFIPIRCDFLLLDILSSLGEQLKWNQAKLPVNATARVNVLLTRVLVRCCPLPWPLFVNPDHQLMMWIQVVQDGGGPQLEREVLGVPAKNPLAEEDDSSSSDLLEPAADKAPGSILDGLSPDEDGEIDWIPESITEKPPNNLWIHCITNDNLDHILLTAAFNGMAVLVTHIERRPLTPVLQKLLGVKAQRGDLSPWELTFGKQRFEVKPTFRLYLSTSLPLCIVGSELDQTFLKKVRVTDLTISQSGLQEIFLKEVLHFENQRDEDIQLTRQLDILYLQHQLKVTQEELMDKVIQTATSLLHDETIKADALENQRAKTEIRTNIKAQSTEGKDRRPMTDDPYLLISHIGSEMYWALVHISRLNPLYYFSKTGFMKVVRESLSHRNLRARPPGAGSSLDHFMDLMNDLISRIYKYFQWCMFVKDARLYRFLVAVAHMKMTNMVTQVEWQLFLRGTRDLKHDAPAQDNCVARPLWVSEDIWQGCTILELLPPFHDLRYSLVQHASQWREYFGLSSTVIGTAPCSDFSHLTTFQKAILWRLFQPNKLSVIMNDVVTCELGGALIRDRHLSLTSLFNYSRQNVPIMFIMPDLSAASLSTHPLYWIEQLAKHQHMQDNVRIITFGSDDQMEEILHGLQKNMSEGNWLVLNNCHLAERWDNRVVTLLTQLLNAYKSYVPSTPAAPPVTSEHYLCDDGPVQDIPTFLTESGDRIHRDFRLWLISRNEASGSLPGILRRHTRKLVIETPSMLQNTLKRTYTQAKTELGGTVSPKLLTILTALHSILLHRQHYGSWVHARSYRWTQADLFAALHTQWKLQTAWEGSEALLELLVGLAVYQGHMLDRGDEVALISIISHCVRSSQSFSARGISSLISSLTSTTGSMLMDITQQDIESRIDHMPNSIESVTVGVCNGFEKQLFEWNSEAIGEILFKSQTLFIPQRLDSSRDQALAALVRDCMGIVQQLRDSLRPQQGDPGPEAAQVSTEPLRAFLWQERRDFKLLIDHLLSDLSHTLGVLQGGRLHNAESDKIIRSLESGRLPRAWRLLTGIAPPLAQWVRVLRTRLQLLNGYMDGPETPVSYNLGAFQRPRMLLITLLQEQAQKQHLALNRLTVQAQVLSSLLPPTSPPENGIYLSGLQLHNALWDTRHGFLQDTLSITPCTMPVVWLRAQEGQAARADQPCPQYECPVYQGAENIEVDLTDSGIIVHLALPARIDPLVCAQRRVHIASII